MVHIYLMAFYPELTALCYKGVKLVGPDERFKNFKYLKLDAIFHIKFMIIIISIFVFVLLLHKFNIYLFLSSPQKINTKKLWGFTKMLLNNVLICNRI